MSSAAATKKPLSKDQLLLMELSKIKFFLSNVTQDLRQNLSFLLESVKGSL